MELSDVPGSDEILVVLTIDYRDREVHGKPRRPYLRSKARVSTSTLSAYSNRPVLAL